MRATSKIFFLSIVFEYNLKKGNIICFMAMNAQPIQQQGENKFNNNLVSFISFDTMNEKKGGKNETLTTSIILGRDYFDTAFMADVVFRARN